MTVLLVIQHTPSSKNSEFFDGGIVVCGSERLREAVGGIVYSVYVANVDGFLLAYEVMTYVDMFCAAVGHRLSMAKGDRALVVTIYNVSGWLNHFERFAERT